MKTKYWIFGGIAAVLLAGLIWFACTYTIIGGHIYDRDITTVNLSDIELKNPKRVTKLKSLQEVDLRNTGLTPEEYDHICAALPDCQIVWLVPFQDNLLDPSSTSLTISSITEEEMELLAYFPVLQTIDMKTCTDVDTILKIMDLYPQCKIQWMVPFQNESIPCDEKNLTISSLSQEDLETIRYFTMLESVDARECGDLEAILNLRQLYPNLSVSWLVPIGNESYAGDSVDLEVRDADAQDLMTQLKYFPQLKTITLSGKTPDNDTMLQLRDAYPEIEISWNFKLCGVSVNSSVVELDLSEIQMKSVKEVEKNLKYFSNLEKVIMYKCGISSEDMDALWKRHPEIRFVWGAKFGNQYIRTDETTFMPWKLGYSRDGHARMNNEEAAELKYLVDLVAIDTGHSKISDLSFLYYMPNVEYLMICDSYITDLTPVGSLKKLKYLEIWENKCTDLSPLAECTALEDINLTIVPTKDLSPLLGLNLKNIWLSGWRYPEEEIDRLKATFPDATIKDRGTYPTSFGWRTVPNYFVQRDLLGLPYMKSASLG